jgi:hypothetical protein
MWRIIGTAISARNNKTPIKTIKRQSPVLGSDAIMRSVTTPECAKEANSAKLPVNWRLRNVNGSTMTAAAKVRTNSDGKFLNTNVKTSATV